MAFSRLLKTFKGKFSARVFLWFALFIAAVSCSFTAFFIQYQGKELRENLIRDGELMARLLAYNSRLGVFAEEEKILDNLVNGLFQNRGVLFVSIYTPEGTPVKSQWKEKTGLPKGVGHDEKTWQKITKEAQGSKEIFHRETGDGFEFWMPVLRNPVSPGQELMYLGEDSGKQKDINANTAKKDVIGFVEIIISKQILKESFQVLMRRSFGIAFLFLLAGFLAAYLVAKRTTRPLRKLTEEAIVLGRGGTVKKVPVETGDEIGRLATAFNEMADSLKKRDEEKRELEERLRHAQKMEAIGTLAGGIAHDFNNILQTVICNIKIIQGMLEKDSRAWGYLDDIYSSSLRAVSLTKGLLSFSRKQPVQMKPVDICSAVKEFERFLSTLAGAGIDFRFQLTEKPAVVMADRCQIDQIWMNLASNARDAMPDGGVITIATNIVDLDEKFIFPGGEAKPGPYVLVCFEDSGTGIDKGTREKIFDPFFTTKEVGQGTGLGLSLVYGIIQQHGGFIDVRSESGQGAAFNIYLPLTKERTEEEESFSESPDKGGSETVLMAEDDDKVRGLFGDLLEKNGYRVVRARNGKEAVERFTRSGESVSLLLFDVKMPGKNGIDAYDEIKKMRPDIKALFVSGFADDILRGEGVVKEEINFLPKPVAPDELLSKIREVLDEGAR